VTRPLLVIDGDSFAHRAYHALPKTIRSRGGKGGGAILGFANVLLKLYVDERPSVETPQNGLPLARMRRLIQINASSPAVVSIRV
jgi:5'-3' exonuclease